MPFEVTIEQVIRASDLLVSPTCLFLGLLRSDSVAEPVENMYNGKVQMCCSDSKALFP